MNKLDKIKDMLIEMKKEVLLHYNKDDAAFVADRYIDEIIKYVDSCDAKRMWIDICSVCGDSPMIAEDNDKSYCADCWIKHTGK